MHVCTIAPENVCANNMCTMPWDHGFAVLGVGFIRYDLCNCYKTLSTTPISLASIILPIFPINDSQKDSSLSMGKLGDGGGRHCQG
jgi:hypothetical protein